MTEINVVFYMIEINCCVWSNFEFRNNNLNHVHRETDLQGHLNISQVWFTWITLGRDMGIFSHIFAKYLILLTKGRFYYLIKFLNISLRLFS